MENLQLENINSRIFEIRGVKVMLDSDLAKLYQVETKNLNKAVSRNIKRFPIDFMFQLNNLELENLRFQIGTTNLSMRRNNPYVFTEQGISMLSSVLRSDIAIEINIKIMRTFVEMRRFALTYEELAKKIDDIEKKVVSGEQTDRRIIEILNELMSSDDKENDKIGFIK